MSVKCLARDVSEALQTTALQLLYRTIAPIRDLCLTASIASAFPAMSQPVES